MKKETATKAPEETLPDGSQNAIAGAAADETAAAREKGRDGEKQAPEGKTKNVAPVMYIGPNNLREGLQRYQVFKERPTERMADLKEKYPHIEQVFVPIVRLGAALEEVTKKGTLLHLAYHEILGVTE